MTLSSRSTALTLCDGARWACRMVIVNVLCPRRFEKLEKQAQAASEPVFFIVHYVDKVGVEEKPTAYSCEPGGAQVRKKPGETTRDLLERAGRVLWRKREKSWLSRSLWSV
jgi:hypothetical protein